MVSEKKATDAKNDFQVLSNALAGHLCSNKNCQFLKHKLYEDMRVKVANARLRMGPKATCTVDNLRQDKENLAEENERLKKDVRRLENDVDKLEKGETARIAQVNLEKQ